MTTTETRPQQGFSARLRSELDELHEADAELRARRQDAWERYCARVDEILDQLRTDIDAQAEHASLVDAGRKVLAAFRLHLTSLAR